MEKQQIYLDPTDFDSMISLMDKYGDSKYPYFGENEEGEMVSISIFPDINYVPKSPLARSFKATVTAK